MPKVLLSSQVLHEVSGHVSKGQINKLKIGRYKSGQKKGELFAEYSLLDTPVLAGETFAKRHTLMTVLNRAADELNKGTAIDLVVQKNDGIDNYHYSLSIGGK